MATCKDCLHYEACKSLLEAQGYIVNGAGEDADKRCDTFTDKSRFVECDENLETMLICAERYACGRQTYMPSIVIDFITPLIPKLSDKTLTVIRNDIGDASVYRNLGDSYIDAPLWLKLYRCIENELKRRAES